ncbi:MAG: hypothetical protein QM775_05670 [Pirellulales bacterium]
MVFHSYEFVILFAIVFALYAALDHRRQNFVLLVASLVFYGWWDVRFLGLMALSASIDYVAALRIAATSDAGRRRRWLLLSLAGNFGILGFFKYYNFFVEGAQRCCKPSGCAAIRGRCRSCCRWGSASTRSRP